MEAGIVENDNLTRFKIRNQAPFDPQIENIGSTIAFKTKSTMQTPPTQSCDGRCSARAIARLVGIKPLATRGPASAEADVVINADFIDINKLLDGNRSDQLLERTPFGFVPLLITKALFLKVNPICLNRFQIITPLTSKCLPICTSV